MSHNPLWEYSNRIWHLPGIEPLLVDLQDRFGADINLLLACFWLAAEQRRLTEDYAKQAQQQSQPWLRNCIAPLRGVRRYLGQQQEGYQLLRERVAALELEAERLQQEALYSLLEPCPTASPGAVYANLVEANLIVYCEVASGFGWSDLAESLLRAISLIDQGLSLGDEGSTR